MIETTIKTKKILLFISAGMIEITWLYALNSLLFLMLSLPGFPIWSVLLAFFVPILIIFTLKGTGKRIIELFLLHLFFFTFILLYTIYTYGNWQVQFSFLDPTWLKMIMDHQYGQIEGYSYLLIIFWVSVYWISGFLISKRPNNHTTIASRFDLGITVLVFVFIILWVTDLSLVRPEFLIIYYFLFSMLAFSIAKNLEGSERTNQNQLTGSSMVFTFILLILIFGSWIFLFFLPQLSSVAQTGYKVLKIISKPLGNLLLKIITFLFGYGNMAPGAIHPTSGESGIPILENPEPSWWVQILGKIMGWGAIILLGILVIIAIGWLLWSMGKWFALKTEHDTNRKGFFHHILLGLIYILHLGKKFLNKTVLILNKFRKKQKDIPFYFQKLCRWGLISGIPRKKSHTPQEYGRQLSHFFPDSQENIKLIIESFNQEIYGNKKIQSEELKKIKKAWNSLVSPVKWPLRLWVRLFVSQKNKQQSLSY